MDTGKLISTLALVGSVATAVAVPLANIKPVYGIVAGLTAAVVGAVGKGLIDVKGTALLTALGVIVAVSAAILNFTDAQTILSPQVLAVITHVGAIAAALGKGLMGGGGDDGGSSGGAVGGGSMRFSMVMLLSAVMLTAGCWGRKDATATTKFINQLDNNALAAREIQATLLEMVNLKLLAPATARQFGEKTDRFRGANKQLIEFVDQPEFKVSNTDGSVTITLTPGGKVQAEALAKALVKTAQDVVNDKVLFKDLPQLQRDSLNTLFAAAGNTAQSLITLLNRLKVAKTVTIHIPAADWQRFQHAKEVLSYGF